MLTAPVPAAVTVSVTVAVCTRLPLVPVIVTVELPDGVVLAVVTVSVELPDPVTVAGEKLAAAPVGNPLALSVTTPPKLFNGVIVVVYVPAFPDTTFCVLGLPVIVKSGGGGTAFTTILTGAECVSVPLVPVIVSVDVPTGVVLPVVTVSVMVPDPVTVAGEKLAVAPVGNPLTLGVTTPVNPPSAVIVAVYVAAFPTITVCELGLTANVKSGEVTTCGTIWIPFNGARG